MNSNRFSILVLAIVFCITACQKQPESLMTIPVDTDQESPVKLSEITKGEVKKIPLELTDQSTIGRIAQVLYHKDGRLIVLDSSSELKIMVFDSNGKFIRRISSKGAGPREFVNIKDIALDSNENILYIVTREEKILCYNLDGVFLNEFRFNSPRSIFPQDKYLNVFASWWEREKGNFISRIWMFRVDKKFNIIDSLIIKPECSIEGFWLPDQKVILSHVGKQTYFSYPDASTDMLLRDTLFELTAQQTIPVLKLRFSDEVANNAFMLRSIWRSKRFIFAQYMKRGFFYFVHDLKLNKSSNMKGGLEDDVHHTGEVVITPLLDNKYYYIATPDLNNENLKEEPNPNIYIGEFLE